MSDQYDERARAFAKDAALDLLDDEIAEAVVIDLAALLRAVADEARAEQRDRPCPKCADRSRAMKEPT